MAISVVHSDRPKHAYLNPMSDPRIRSRRGFPSGGDETILQDHRYLESPILGVHPFARQSSTYRLPEPTPLTVYRTVPQVPPPLCSSPLFRGVRVGTRSHSPFTVFNVWTSSTGCRSLTAHTSAQGNRGSRTPFSMS